MFTENFLAQLAPFNPKFNEPLAKYTTWQIGGPAEILVKVKSSEELAAVVLICQEFGVKYTILGGGSNVLIADRGLSGVVIINQSTKIEILASQDFKQIPKISVVHQAVGNQYYTFADLDYLDTGPLVLVKFDSGVSLPYAIGWLHKQGITGLQWFAGIPGTIGGALFNNIHGGSRHFSDNFHSATILLAGKRQVVDFDYFNFGYDQSVLRNQPDLVILEVVLQLPRGDVQKAKQIYQEWNKRKQIQPKHTCGCVFKNISPEDQQRLGLPTPSTGYIIDQILGWKGRTYGHLQISNWHAAFMENLGGATAAEALQLIQEVQQAVKEKLGLGLELEISLLGFSESELAKLK